MTKPTIATKEDIQDLLAQGRREPARVFPAILALAQSEHWQTREVAATALVELGKRHPAAVLQVATTWAAHTDPNVRRTGCEGLRGLVRVQPEAVRPVLEQLCADPETYVKKSVANLLRDAGGKHPEFLLQVAAAWARSASPHTRWILRHGLRKLRLTRPLEVAAILAEDDDEAP